MKKLRLKSGETLVEVLAASAVFLLMMGIMQGAISFCTNAQHKSEAVRTVNADICQKLRSKPFDPLDPGSTAVYSFRAVSADGQQQSGVLFEVKAGLATKSVDYQDESGSSEIITFYVFQSTAPDPAGGGSP